MRESKGMMVTANKRLLGVGLAAAVILQMGVLAVEYLGSVWPLWFGRPIVLQTVPIDPRSLFRGNYVRLEYAISLLDKSLAKTPFRRNQVAYVTLKQEGDVYVPTGMQPTRPQAGVFIRGRVKSLYNGYRMHYGIEAFFMPKRKALQTEREVAGGASAEIYLSPSSGKPAIARLLCDGKDC